ncbi:prolyl 3-hydroxylase sud1 [Brevipalpus obovatus]|uniref:prolyl 3-hydroxylase sud1 n=1 Tax=Brevipalpus obovatus TaxID=246614 RepID=UPI003D9E897E
MDSVIRESSDNDDNVQDDMMMMANGNDDGLMNAKVGKREREIDSSRSCVERVIKLSRLSHNDVQLVKLMNTRLEDMKDDIRRIYRQEHGDSSSSVGDGGMSVDNFELIKEPFKCGVLSNFIEDTEYLHKLRSHLMDDVIYERKNNDLYSFKQSQDFVSLDSQLIKTFRQFMLDQALPFFHHITGIPLYPDELDINASKYESNDVLLCHDDRLDERRIAFILYLVEGWEEDFGGTLDLFDRDENGQPRDIVKKITPQWNSLIFFEVSSQSFHQVSEIINQSRIRLTINGWFRGPQKPTMINCFIESPLPEIKCGTVYIDEDIFTDWINSVYLDSKTQAEIQQDFVESSEINLFQFFRPEKYEQLAEALKFTDGWIPQGPPNKRCFEILNESNYPEIVKECVNLLTSEEMFLTLHNFTGLKFHPLAIEVESDESSDEESVAESRSDNQEPSITNDPRCSIQIRRWTKGSYSLIHDEDPEVMIEGPKLDVILHLNHNFTTNRDSGGFISYIAKNDDDDLLVVEPESNFLSLVYMDEQTVRFTKYLNNSHPDTYHDICLVFRQ